MKRKGWIYFFAIFVSILLLFRLSIVSVKKHYEPIHINKDQLPPLPPLSEDSLKFAYAKFSLLLDDISQNLGGYGNRGAYEQVIDTPYFHLFLLETKDHRQLIATADLLIYPPSLYDLPLDLKQGGHIDAFYLSASHSHHSIGGWAPSPAGKYLAGTYSKKQMERWRIAFQDAFARAKKELKNACTNIYQTSVPNAIQNRLIHQGPTYDPLTIVHFMTEDSLEYAWASYSAHPTTRSKKDLRLSNDYPGILRKNLLDNHSQLKGFAFSAAAVGSQGPRFVGEKSYRAGKQVADLIMHAVDSILEIKKTPDTFISLRGMSIELDLPTPAPRLWEKYALHPRLFKWALQPANAPMHMMQLDDYLFFSLPFDFNAQLARAVSDYSIQRVAFNSFSGDYRGYIVPDSLYMLPRAEAREMNWSGPYAVDYILEVISHYKDEHSDSNPTR
ncbi:MAG: hypothetical protein LAT68_03175 [Cyclobacteriaceae bacterium]|nr:hypothetical protein [Cyclobacteriaceae bacterium]MCH8515309.1 hypothetical protein [Cyclobacteriaceae bacterium]